LTTRRLTAWLVAASLMFAGTFATHCYLFAILSPGHHAAHEGTTSLVGFLCAAPFLFSCLTLLALGLVARTLQSLRGETGARISAWPFGVLAPLGFVLHQYFSNFTGATSSSMGAAFLLGVALQIPLGLLAYLAARALLGVADRLGAALAARTARPRGRNCLVRNWFTPAKQPLPARIARAFAPRGPPLASF
jgi:hypothetical protein